MTATTCSFLPWVRQGNVSAIATEDDPVRDPLGDRLNAHATFPVRVRLEEVSTPVDIQVRLHGPADVLGIDARQVVRTTPASGTSGFPPSYFPAIEFDRPDFPWLFTPARAEQEQGRLRPWLVAGGRAEAGGRHARSARRATSRARHPLPGAGLAGAARSLGGMGVGARAGAPRRRPRRSGCSACR